MSPDALVRALARYDAADAAVVARRIRAEAGREAAMDELIGIYREVLAEHAASPAPDPVEETRAASAYLRWLGPFLKVEMGAIEQRERLWARGEHVRLAAARDQARAEQDTLRAEAVRLDGALSRLAGELAEIRAAAGEARAETEAVRIDRDGALEALAVLRGSLTVRSRERLLATPVVGELARLLLRVAKTGRPWPAAAPSAGSR